jgi:hypothetical protein
MAQMRYTEPVATLDADVLIAVAAPERMDVLAEVYEFCTRRGFRSEGESIALSVGRAKDYARILALLESDSATRQQIARLAARHGLSEAWDRFEARFADD